MTTLNATLLHISDIHRTEDEPVTTPELLQWLVADLARHASEGIPHPDIVVVSGDLTQTANAPEYEDATKFLDALLSNLHLPPERLVVVPGNHDVYWPACEDNVRRRSKLRTAVEESLSYRHDNTLYTYESESAFQARLSNFRSFYSTTLKNDYPEDRTAAFTHHIFDALHVQVVGLSSIDGIDHDRRRPSFNPASVAAATEAMRRTNLPTLLVWHHDADWGRGETDCLPAADLRLLSSMSALLGLCGHTHRHASNDVCRIEGYPLPVVAAGSLCAGPRQRNEGVPRSYNIINVTDDRARVWVRGKATKSDPWRDVSQFGEPNSRRSWYDVSFQPTQPVPREHRPTSTRIQGQLRAPNPFLNLNAKSTGRDRVLADYVETQISSDAQIDLPQIIIGPRGSGKTALLFTLTLQAQLRALDGPGSPIPLVGLYCPMKVNEISAFNGKGSIPIETRKQLFRGALASIWATEMVDSLELYKRWLFARAATTLPEAAIVASLARAWALSCSCDELSALRVAVRTLRDRTLLSLSRAAAAESDASVDSLREIALFRGGQGPLEDAARELAAITAFQQTKWTILFDEVEFLNKWQQECVYEHVGNLSQATSCKVATLPYAHLRALDEFPSVLVLGEDYGELAVELVETTGDFERVAKGLWASRLEGLDAPPLEEIWPEEPYEVVLGRVWPDVATLDELDTILMDDLPADRRPAAANLRDTDPRAFDDQFRRKFRESFRFRLAARAAKEQDKSIPLYWGWRQMLKACGGNPRQFLALAELCWTSYWAKGGIKPLSADEQFVALRRWGLAFASRCASLPHRGQELQAIVKQVVERVHTALYATPHLRNEYLTIRIEDCDQEQAEAIAIGIAYGMLVPRLRTTEEQRLLYPSTEVVMRLGYPVAVANELPLRQGEALKISTLRQLELPWWKD